MRTDKEILEKMESLQDDFFGTMSGDLLETLSWESAKPFLKDDVTEEKWNSVKLSRKREAVLLRMCDYMSFAWGKANDNRGLSAVRSIAHMRAWIWLAGDDELLELISSEYSHYGKPQLRAICEYYEWDWRPMDDDRWTNDEMKEGVKADDVPRLELVL